MKHKAMIILDQKELAIILTALSSYEIDLNYWESEDINEKKEKIQIIKHKLNNKLIKTLKIRKIKKEDDLPF